MRFVTRVFTVVALLAAVAGSAAATPNTGTYTSTDLGGQLLTGRASVNRLGINSGLPHTLHSQSYDPGNGFLGTQWEVRCPVENVPFLVQDNRDGSGTGTVVYTSTFQGGEFELFNTGGPWGDGIAQLNSTVMISTVQFVNNVPVASVVNGNTSGSFGNGCALTFSIANGVGVGETTSLNPLITKPVDYPTFLDSTCQPAAGDQQYGTWGNVITITMRIDCVVPAEPATWGSVKASYR
jgi:hypothetical protein